MGLFIERAGEADVTVDLTEPDERAAVAAARNASMVRCAWSWRGPVAPPERIVEPRDEIDSVLPVVRRDFLFRQQSLERSVGASEQLLDPPARAVCRLVVLAVIDADVARLDPLMIRYRSRSPCRADQLVEALFVMVECWPGSPN